MPRQTSVLSISIPQKLTKEIDIISKKMSQTRSELVRNAIREYIQNLQEDVVLTKLANIRDTKNAKYLSHEEVWG